MKIKKQEGFTLIELVVVIALLGILAAFAIPRFASLETEARSATTQGLSGSVRSASALAHGLFLATGNDPVTMEGVAVDMVFGYPAATDIQNALADTTGFTVAVAAGTATFTKTGASTPANCVVTYAEATAATTPPVINVVTTGC